MIFSNVDFIHTPRTRDCLLLFLGFFCYQRRITNHPTVQRSMIHISSSLFHNLFKTPCDCKFSGVGTPQTNILKRLSFIYLRISIPVMPCRKPTSATLCAATIVTAHPEQLCHRVARFECRMHLDNFSIGQTISPSMIRHTLVTLHGCHRSFCRREFDVATMLYPPPVGGQFFM